MGTKDKADSPSRLELVERLLNPMNVAIVGASARKGGWPDAVFHNLRDFGYEGAVYPVNPRYEELWGERCYPSVKDLPEPPDHLAVLVPATGVLGVLEEAVRAGARSATVFAGGFGEGGDPEGLQRQARLARLIAETGLAVCGPNCLGNLSAASKAVTLTDRSVSRIDSGPVAIVGQSGGVVLFLHSAMRNRGLDVRYAISSGNEVGLKVGDYISYCAEDPEVRVIVAFIESIGEVHTFLEACDKAHRLGKPVVAVKVGGSAAARAAAAAHTGALAGTLAAFDAVAARHGVLRVDSLEQLIEAAEYCAHASLPDQPGAAAILYSGGLRELLLEGAERTGVVFPPLAPETWAALDAVLPVGTTTGNPLDSGWGGLSSSEIYFKCVDALLADPAVGLLLAQEKLPGRPGEARTEEYIAGLEQRARIPGGKPIAVFSMVTDTVNDYGIGVRRTAPHLPFLQGAEGALGAVAAIGRYLNGGGSGPALEQSGAEERTLHRGEGRKGGATATEADAKRLVAAYGVPVLEEVVERSQESVWDVVKRIGYPVVVKGLVPGVAHKSEAGLVYTDLTDAEQVAAALADIQRVAAERDGGEQLAYLVAPHAPDGFDLALGWEVDPEVGPVVMFGWGGVTVELMADVRFIAVPVSLEAARRAIHSTKAGRILRGYRGGPAYDLEFVERSLVTLGSMAEAEAGRFAALDINPLRVWAPGRGGAVLDALIVPRSGGLSDPGEDDRAC